MTNNNQKDNKYGLEERTAKFGESVIDFVKQMKMPVRIIDPRGVPVWTKGVDHHRLADAYENLASMISGMKNSTPNTRSWHVNRN